MNSSDGIAATAAGKRAAVRQAWTHLTPTTIPTGTAGFLATRRLDDGSALIMGPFPNREAAQQLGPHWTITPTPEVDHGDAHALRGCGEIHELNDLWPGPYDLLICDACKRERAADEIAAEQEGW